MPLIYHHNAPEKPRPLAARPKDDPPHPEDAIDYRPRAFPLTAGDPRIANAAVDALTVKKIGPAMGPILIWDEKRGPKLLRQNRFRLMA